MGKNCRSLESSLRLRPDASSPVGAFPLRASVHLMGLRRLALALSLLSPLCGQFPRPPFRGEVELGTTYLMPRSGFANGWGVMGGGALRLSPRSSVRLFASTTALAPSNDQANGDSTHALAAAQFERIFLEGSSVETITSIGLGRRLDGGDPDLFFVFGASLRIPLVRGWVASASLRDYHADLGIPFLSVPGGRVAVQGSGSRYLELSLTFARHFAKGH